MTAHAWEPEDTLPDLRAHPRTAVVLPPDVEPAPDWRAYDPKLHIKVFAWAALVLGASMIVIVVLGAWHGH